MPSEVIRPLLALASQRADWIDLPKRLIRFFLRVA